MFLKTYGLFYKNGKWHTRNYGRVLKKGGFTWGNAKIGAWWRNKKRETPIIDLKRIVPQPWAKEEYGPVITVSLEGEREPDEREPEENEWNSPQFKTIFERYEEYPRRGIKTS